MLYDQADFRVLYDQLQADYQGGDQIIRVLVDLKRAARFLASERRREPDLRFPSLARSEGIGFHL